MSAAIGFSVFTRVRERGRSAACQNNLRQIYLAIQQYVQDNDSWYPKDRDSISGSFWPYRILPYVKTKEVFYCPNFSFLKGPYGLATYPLNQSSYTFNAWRLSAVQIGPGRIAKNEAEVEVRLNPNATWLNYCLDTHYLNERPLPSIPPNTTLTASCGRKAAFLDGTHHSGGTNWSFLDGHIKWMTMQQVADMDCANPTLPPNALPQGDRGH